MQITVPVTKKALLSLQKTGEKAGVEKQLFSQIFEKMRTKKQVQAPVSKSAVVAEKVVQGVKPVKVKKDEGLGSAEVLAAFVSKPAAQTQPNVKNKKKEAASGLKEEAARTPKAAPVKEGLAQESEKLQEAPTDKSENVKVFAQTTSIKKSTTAYSNETKNQVAKKEAEPVPSKEQPAAKKPEKAGRISVRDLRTETAQETTGQSSETVTIHQTQQSYTGNSQSDLVVDLRSNFTSSNLSSGASEFTQTNQFETVLAQELQDNISGDIVRQAQVVLKNGDSGTIRLSLKPESLGTVKVHLEMVENKLIGHIVVESAEVLRAFEREVHSLEQAFRDSGFQTAHLDTRLAGGGGDGADGRRQNTDRFFSERLAALYDNFEPEAPSITEILEMQQINVLV